MDNAKFALGVALVALIVGAGGYFYPQAKQAFGEIGTRWPNGIYVGTIANAPSKVSNFAFGASCFLAPSAATIAATTTVSVDCQATAGWSAAGTSALGGVSSGDAIQFELSTTTAGASGPGGLVVTGASASTTAGYITVRLLNLTGTTFTWPTTGVASGTASYLDLR